MQQKFYQDLFTSKKSIPLENSTYFSFLENLPRLSQAIQENLDLPLTLEELEIVIKQSKLNKAPGPDGYTNEFFKFFRAELQVWLFRAYQESFECGMLSPEITNGTITCIPKSGKLRNSLKNWRPLTLLNGSYKFLSSIIAERLKKVLELIVNSDQTGFIANRFIGENTRLIFDTIIYTENENIPGLLVIVDYAKAFDTLEWSYIDQCLKLFNFGEYFSDWVRLLRTGSMSKVEQCGNFSDNIVLSRGCRQGDPISPYIFVLCAEILSHVIRENNNIKGIIVHDRESKLTQYADDTTIFLGGDKESLCCVMRVLEWFRKVSGLAINIDKTNVVKIGALRGRSIPWEGKFGMKWVTDFEILGIKYKINHMDTITDDNILGKLAEIKNLIHVWNSRCLSPYGKITIVESLLLSKITHILLSLPTPSQHMFSRLESIFSNFIWNSKPPKFRRDIVEALNTEGGLQLHNLKIFDAALKIGWLKRYLRTDSKWKVIPMEAELSGLFTYGVAYLNRIIEMTFNPFWNDVLSGLKWLWTDLKIVIPENVLLTPLWYNDSLQLPIKKEWLLKGITNISDILDVNLKPLLLHDFSSIYGVKTNFLEYGQVCKKVKLYLENKILPFHLPTKPYNSILNVILSMDTKGVSNIYKLFKGKNTSVLENATNKWNEKIDFQLDVFSVKKSFSNIKKFDDVYLRYIQFRTLHRRFFTNNILFKMKQKSSILCDFCKDETDSNEHMFLNCVIIRQLWREVENWISQIGVVDYIINEERIILGELKNHTG